MTTSRQNIFSLGAQLGGPDVAEAARRQEQRLRDAMNRWRGDYSAAIREFAFILRVDGKLHRYTELFGILGAQPAKRKRDWLEVEIGVPEAWWREAQRRRYMEHLADEIDKGFHSMIELLRRNKHPINADALLADWRKIRQDYLADAASQSDVER